MLAEARQVQENR